VLSCTLWQLSDFSMTESQMKNICSSSSSAMTTKSTNKKLNFPEFHLSPAQNEIRGNHFAKIRLIRTKYYIHCPIKHLLQNKYKIYKFRAIDKFNPFTTCLCGTKFVWSGHCGCLKRPNNFQGLKASVLVMYCNSL